jgi:predicted nucleic acid-binding protein
MIRVYIDTNIFCRMRTKESQVYEDLFSLLQERKDVFFPIYSRAHIEDLKNDDTETKFDDIKFVEKIAGTYLLYYDAVNKEQKMCLAKPINVLNDHLEMPKLDLSNLFDKLFNDLIDDDSSPELKGLLNTFKEIADKPVYQVNIPTEQIKGALKEFVPNGSGAYSLKDFTNYIGDLSNKLHNKDNTLYKTLRGENKQQFNLDQWKNGLQDLNDLLKKSPLGKNFIELVDSMYGDVSQRTMSNYFTNAFIILNMLGMDKEKNSNVKFANTSTDSQHAYYATYCDVLITIDKGLKTKGNLVYETINNVTKILSVEEFITEYKNIPQYSFKTKQEFLLNLIRKIKESNSTSSYKSEQFNRTTFYYELDYKYFEYFDFIECIDDKDLGVFLVMHSKRSYYHSGLFYKEIELTTGKIVTIFGEDLEKKEFYSEIDESAINSGAWEGRLWGIGKTPITLEINSGTKKLCLTIGPITEE